MQARFQVSLIQNFTEIWKASLASWGTTNNRLNTLMKKVKSLPAV
jgi:hypothetical protein